jgi:hypothetical protein
VTKCDRPPVGWHCARDTGHDGPCAAHPHRETLEALSVETQTAALLIDPKVKLPPEVRRFEAAALTEIAALRSVVERRERRTYWHTDPIHPCPTCGHALYPKPELTP